jgi:hypothetical protein
MEARWARVSAAVQSAVTMVSGGTERASARNRSAFSARAAGAVDQPSEVMVADTATSPLRARTGETLLPSATER